MRILKYILVIGVCIGAIVLLLVPLINLASQSNKPKHSFPSTTTSTIAVVVVTPTTAASTTTTLTTTLPSTPRPPTTISRPAPTVPRHKIVPMAPPTMAPVLPTSSPVASFGCPAALAYLAMHQAPGFVDVCARHSAFGNYGLTCYNHVPECTSAPPGNKMIYIACPSIYVYENEASNSQVEAGLKVGPIDPYGLGTVAQHIACNGYA